MRNATCFACESRDDHLHPCPNNGACPTSTKEDALVCPTCKKKHCSFCGGEVVEKGE